MGRRHRQGVSGRTVAGRANSYYFFDKHGDGGRYDPANHVRGVLAQQAFRTSTTYRFTGLGPRRLQGLANDGR